MVLQSLPLGRPLAAPALLEGEHGVPLSTVVALLLQRPVHYVVIVAKQAPVEPWFACAEAEAQRPELPPLSEAEQQEAGDEQAQRNLEMLLQHLAASDVQQGAGDTPQSVPAREGQDKGTGWREQHTKQQRGRSATSTPSRPSWAISAGSFGPLAGQWETAEDDDDEPNAVLNTSAEGYQQEQSACGPCGADVESKPGDVDATSVRRARKGKGKTMHKLPTKEDWQNPAQDAGDVAKPDGMANEPTCGSHNHVARGGDGAGESAACVAEGSLAVLHAAAPALAGDDEVPVPAIARWADCDPESQSVPSIADAEDGAECGLNPVNGTSSWTPPELDAVLQEVLRGLVGFKLAAEPVSLFLNDDELEVSAQLHSRRDLQPFARWSQASGAVLGQELATKYARLGVSRVAFFGLWNK